MTLRRKTQIALGITLLLILLMLDLTFTNFLRRSAEQTDRERITLNLSRAVVSINAEAKTLSAIAANWAHSDATWDYMNGRNANYAAETLNRDALTEIGISSMIFIDSGNMVRLFKDFSSDDEPSSPESEFVAIFDDPRNQYLLDYTGPTGTSGIVLKENQPVLFTVKPILTSDIQGPPAGNLIVTRTISPKLIANISRNLHFNFAIEPTTENEKQNADKLPLILIEDAEKNATTISARMLVKDHSGTPSFWVRGIDKKEDIAAAEKKIQFLFLIFGVIAVLLSFLYDFFFKHAFSNRMKRLQREVEAIRDEKGHKGIVTVDSNKDEINSLQRTLSDVMAYHDFKQEHKSKMDSISLMVYERFAQAGNRLCYKTLEDIATAFSPGDDKFRNSLPRSAKMTVKFCDKLKLPDEEKFYAYLGALFSRIGLLGIPFSVRNKTTELSPVELREYHKYPILSKDFLESVELLRPATQIPHCWNEKWDGTGFPKGLSGSAIPLTARIFAIVDTWNEMTRPWLGRKLPTQEEVELKLREMAGTKFDPYLTEQFIQLLHDERKTI
ncbi:MAG: CHASE4 domain-containing protein [Synergistaceae bacterium]|nr:CHASE4 domain-containing protein [Synergistaceae bacterium]